MKAARETELVADRLRAQGEFLPSALTYLSAAAMFEKEAEGAFHPAAMYREAERCVRSAATMLDRFGDLLCAAGDEQKRSSR